MKNQVKFIVWIVILAVGITGAALYQKGYFTKESSKSPAKVETSSNVNTIQGEIQINAINKNMIGDDVSIIGEIINRRDQKDGHVFITVKDSSGEILVPIFADKKILTDSFIIGNQFKIIGHVEEFNGELEVVPSNQQDIVPVDQSVEIEEKDEGEVKTISGKVMSKYAHPEGHTFLIIKVETTGQELDIPLFKTLNPNPDHYPINSVVTVKGKVSIYKGKLQIIPDSLNDITMLEKGDDTAINTVKLSDITEANRGKMVITSGFVKNVVEKNGNLFFKLSDNEKEISTVLFKADSNEIAGRKQRILNAEKAQFEVRILGMVDIYNGELEVIIDKVLVD
jgi:DNA/RNA endonuclease YhcR with UshA esterase domain